MLFSEYYKIKQSKDESWFDPFLSIDTPLFLDPFLLYAQEENHFIGSHDEIINFFNSIFTIIAKSQGNKDSIYYQKAVNDLLFPEVEELCLGYTAAGTGGSGSGLELAKVIASALWEAIQAGVKEITHFEEIDILREGIGADRISDATAWILRNRLAKYTNEICVKHNIPIKAYRYLRGIYDIDNQRWAPITVGLPENPYNRKPILLIPRHYIRNLPTINADDFWDYCYNYENETLRREFSYDVTRRVRKTEIIKLARRYPDLRKAYLKHIEGKRPNPYDLLLDEKGYYVWYDASSKYCITNPLSFQIVEKSDFFSAIDQMVSEYSLFVEENNGWRLLWNDNKTRKGEKAAQLLFLGIVKHYCKANDIDISPESNIGRGPVDFKAARGYRLRVLLELTLASNTKFWNGLDRQLPTYMRAEQINYGYFIVLVFTDSDVERLNNIQNITNKVSDSTGYKITTIVVDASSEKPSASKL